MVGYVCIVYLFYMGSSFRPEKLQLLKKLEKGPFLESRLKIWKILYILSRKAGKVGKIFLSPKIY